MTRFLPLLAAVSLLPAPALAQTVLSGAHSVDGDFCAGVGCTDNENFFGAPMKLKANNTRLYFDDDSLPTSNYATNDWVLQANDSNISGDSYFAITDAETSNKILRLDAGAPANSLYVTEDGTLGLGTMLPQANLHIVDTSIGEARLRLENTQGTNYAWDLRGNHVGFYLYDATAGTLPFNVRPGAPNSSLDVASNGNVGIGTPLPNAPLEVSDDATFSFFRITAEQAAINQSVDITFTGGPLGTGELRYNIVDGDGPEMKLNADGDMQIGGTLTTAGSCSVGCDAVFDADYPLPSIEDHLAETLALGHLPNVGPTRHGAPWDMTDKLGRVLNELEHAHLYIGQLHQELGAQKAEKQAMEAQIAALAARLDALERAD
ncbi:hypothetical protein [Roseovarius indicus]|uniref:hypothetical protein n=1 Tax=Roseovarius indicus TaxID=540747 RepID=UPI0032EB8B91